MSSYKPQTLSHRPYAGDLDIYSAWSLLGDNGAAVLVDVRSDVEWQLIGKPDLASIDKVPIFLELVTVKGANPSFINDLVAELELRAVAKDDPILFLCRSGGRSRLAATECAAQGYSQCFNINEGFEGRLDSNQHRNSIDGWKVAGLPWVQS